MGPFERSFRPEKPPFRRLGGLLGVFYKKRETLSRFPCSCKDTQILARMQMPHEKGGQSFGVSVLGGADLKKRCFLFAFYLIFSIFVGKSSDHETLYRDHTLASLSVGGPGGGAAPQSRLHVQLSGRCHCSCRCVFCPQGAAHSGVALRAEGSPERGGALPHFAQAL